MKLTRVTTPLTEMAAKKICPTCGNPMAGYHYWYKGGWKCKQSSLAGNAPSTSATPASATPATPTSTKKATSQKTKATLEDWLARHGINTFTVNPDGSVDVDGSVYLDTFSGVRIPAKFNMVSGDFSCSGAGLTTLVNCPVTIGGDFRVNHNDLETLEGFPTHVGGSVDISGNQQLTSLEGMNGVTIGGSLHGINLKKLSSLKDIHKRIKSIGDVVDFTGSPIVSNVLGAMMIKGVRAVRTNNKEADKIMNAHLDTDQDALQAQDELIDAGYPKLAGP